jgi:solute:Na+ symporter, SSS family
MKNKITNHFRIMPTLLLLTITLYAFNALAELPRPVLFEAEQRSDWMMFSEAADMPSQHGVSGAYIGTSDKQLMVAGGSFFSTPLTAGGGKEYSDQILTLSQPITGATWKVAGKLPFPIAHGAAVSNTDGIICVGGENQRGPLNLTLIISYDSATGRVNSENSLPKLPRPLSYLSATRINNRLYVAGGKDSDGRAVADFMVLNLSDPKQGWLSLPTWPDAPRYGVALVSQYIENKGYVYLFGGKSDNDYPNTSFRYDPESSRWQQIAPLPRAALLAPAIATGQSRILLFSGSDGFQVNRWRELAEEYCFPREVLAYHTITDTWTQHGEMPYGVAGSSAVEWAGGIVIPGGELRPGQRVNKVLIARIRAAAVRFGWIDQTALYLYLAALTALCVWLYFRHRRAKTTEDFFLGGRDLPGWAAGMSLMATAVSSIGFMAIPAKTFATDWTYFAGTLTWFIVVPVVIIAFIPFFRRINVTTAYELLETRFDVKIRTFAAIGFSLMESGRMAIVLLLPATALATVTPLSVEQTVIMMGSGAIVYAILAGMRGVVWTDVVQGIVMLAGALLCVTVAVSRVGGGLTELISTAAQDGKFAFDLSWSPTSAGIWIVMLGNIFIRLATFTSSQSSVQRLLSTPDNRQAARALWADVWVSLPWAVIVFSLGTALYVFYKRFPAALPPNASDIEILPIFMSQQLPPGFSGIVIAAIFAAGMSSLDTSMHSLATTWSRDFYGRFLPGSSDRSQLIFSKIMILVFGILATGSALLIHYVGIRGMWDFFISLFGLFSGILCGIFMLARFSHRANATGTLTGGCLSFILMILVWRYNIVHGLLYTALGTLLCMILSWIFSRLSSGNSSAPRS